MFQRKIVQSQMIFDAEKKARLSVNQSATSSKAIGTTFSANPISKFHQM